jgi:hypothetical protein
LQQLGPIVRLQVQRSALKVPSAPGAVQPRRFEPAALLEVSALLLSPEGVQGLIEDQEPVIDVHHAGHAETKNVGNNAVSVGFSAHYAAMSERFGAHIANGIAGENIIVATDDPVDEDVAARGLAIRTRDGQLVELAAVVFAEPCVEFTRFALRLDASEPTGPEVTEGLRFLRHGMRGFYASYTGAATVLRVGDVVFALG